MGVRIHGWKGMYCAFDVFLNTKLQQRGEKSREKIPHSSWWNAIVIFMKIGFHQRILHNYFKNEQKTVLTDARQ